MANGGAMKPTPEQEAATLKLYRLATQHHNGQARYVGRFLVGLYNGQRFPFDLTDLRCLDTSLFMDCLHVLIMDYQPKEEIHLVIGRLLGRPVDFEALAKIVGAIDRGEEG
jgi:hypothetical protein